MARLVGVLQSLGATRQRDGSYGLDLSVLQLSSIFGGELDGVAVVDVQADAIAFKSPPELAACGKLWMPEVKDDDALCQAVGVALDDLRTQTRTGLATLRRLGFKARVSAPDPRPRGTMQINGVDVDVVIDANGDLVIHSVGGHPATPEQRRSLMAPEEATAAEAKELVTIAARTQRVLATNANDPSLSQEELNELQAALSDSDEDSPLASEEAEPTMAGVAPPTRGPVRPNDDDDDDAGTLKMAFNAKEALAATRPPPPVTGAKVAKGSLIDEFDDDDDDDIDDIDPPTAAVPMMGRPKPAVSALNVDVDFDSGDGDAFGDEPEPTATRPIRGAATAVPVPTAAHQRPTADDSDDDDILGGLRDSPPMPSARANQISVDDFPGLGDGAAPFVGVDTSVNAGDLPSSGPTAAFANPHPRAPASVDDAFEGNTTGPQPQNATDDDFDDGKTRALIVDAALLARLKLGDVGGAPDVPTFAPPGRATDDFEPPPTSVVVDDIAPVVVPVVGADDDLASLLDEDPSRDVDDSVDLSVDLSVDQGGDVSAHDIDASGFDDGDDVNDPNPPAADDDSDLGDLSGVDDAVSQGSASPFAIESGAEAELEIQRLQARSVALEAELVTVRQQLAALLAHQENTGSRTATVRNSSLPTEARPAVQRRRTLAADEDEPPRVGDSDDGSSEGETVTAGAMTSLPSLQSIDVHEIQAPGSGSLMDEFDDDVPASDVPADDGRADAASAIDDDDGGFSNSADADHDDVPADSDDVVSFAALQGALKEMGVELGEGGETQVAVSVMPFALPNDDGGDVFGTGGGPSLDSLASQAGAEAALSEEATRIRPGRMTSSIALVVEDDRARVRLRKHLAARFSALIEATDGRSVMQMKGIADVDAIVFVRPTHDDSNVASITRLGGLPHRPRVLIISHDDTFDALDAVDLRLPLGQRASEVAQQVLDGLERLGIQLSPLG